MKTVEIFTDGSCKGNPGPGGWCAILKNNGHEKILSGGEKSTTNNRMEITAVVEGLKALKEPCVVELYSDSQYVCNAISKGWARKWESKGWMRDKGKPALNPDLWKEILKLSESHKINVHWVKGHAGMVENERCDQIAVSQARKFC